MATLTQSFFFDEIIRNGEEEEKIDGQNEIRLFLSVFWIVFFYEIDNLTVIEME